MSSASRVAAISGAQLTRTHRTHAGLRSTTISRRIDARAVGHYNTISRSFTSSSSLLPSPSTSTSAKKDVTTGASKRGPSSQSRPGTPRPSEDDFKINFRDLGMSRITKLVVYSVICVLGTMETIFWCKVLWRWWTSDEEGSE
ncbi:hypothetical protein F5Y10DRAFT_267154 [Nemania abortiva]|nr:hypothetical protein F5Y10DRAFT_267154 [Nemania abortiva]